MPATTIPADMLFTTATLIESVQDRSTRATISKGQAIPANL